MTNEAKVGAFTIGGAALLGVILIGLSGVSLFTGKTYRLEVAFSKVTGLNPGSEVRYAGVKVGRVTDIAPTSTGALVTAEVDGDIKVPLGSVITIDSSGFLSEKFVGIEPGLDQGRYFKDGDRVTGASEAAMDSMMSNMNTLVNEARDMLAGINSVVNDPAVKSSMAETAVNMRDITSNVKSITGTIARLTSRNEEDFRQVARNINLMSQSLMETTAEVENLVKNFTDDGTTGANLQRTIANITETSGRIDNMARVLETVVTDPQTAEDLKATLHNTRQVTEKANAMLGGAGGGFHTKAGAEAMYSGKAGEWDLNADLRLYTSKAEDSFLMLGVNDVGERNRLNLQAGKKFGTLTGRAGIVESKAGLGLDADAGTRWKFSVEAYDLNDIKLKTRAQYRMAGDTYLFGQINDVNHKDDRATFFGIRQEF